jgi:ATP-dependent DNA helicase HFM1/MER3
LPAHLVIIKNTQALFKHPPVELDDSTVLQMIGRAGRPQFDDTGVAVILTRREQREKYENLVTGRTILESRLPLQLTEHINAEIGLGTISNLESAKNWLRSTFFFVRLQLNFNFYCPKAERKDANAIIREMCDESLRKLQDAGMVAYVNGRLVNTVAGEAASKYYLKSSTIKRIREIGDEPTLRVLVVLHQVCVDNSLN